MLFKAAEASVAHPSRALLFPSAPSDPGQWGTSSQWAVLVGSDGRIQSLLNHSSVHQGTVPQGKAFLKNFTVGITWKSHP